MSLLVPAVSDKPHRAHVVDCFKTHNGPSAYCSSRPPPELTTNVWLKLEGAYVIPAGTQATLMSINAAGQPLTQTIDYCNGNFCPQRGYIWEGLLAFPKKSNGVLWHESRIELKTPAGLMLVCVNGTLERTRGLESQEEITLIGGHGRTVRNPVEDDEADTFEL